MQEIPLFPLQTVLFPGAPLRLHIFEERYKTMIHSCIQKEQPFGVVLIRRGEEAHGPLAEPYLVGTLAKIIQVQNLPDRQMDIATVGLDRFQIVSLEADAEPYLIGYIESFPLLVSNQSFIEYKLRKLRILVARYLQGLIDVGAGQFDIDEFPQDPAGFAYFSASLLQISNQHKQSLLAIKRAETLLTEVTKAFSRETALLGIYATQPLGGGDLFSKN